MNQYVSETFSNSIGQEVGKTNNVHIRSTNGNQTNNNILCCYLSSPL